MEDTKELQDTVQSDIYWGAETVFVEVTEVLDFSEIVDSGRNQAPHIRSGDAWFPGRDVDYIPSAGDKVRIIQPIDDVAYFISPDTPVQVGFEHTLNGSLQQLHVNTEILVERMLKQLELERLFYEKVTRAIFLGVCAIVIVGIFQLYFT